MREFGLVSIGGWVYNSLVSVEAAVEGQDLNGIAPSACAGAEGGMSNA